ncbi:hypothetical protein OROMI_016863 [Orobanche minor]
MAMRSLRRTLLRALKHLQSSSSIQASQSSWLLSNYSPEPSTSASSPPFSRLNLSCNSIFCRLLSSQSEESFGSAAINYRSVLQEDEYQRLANSTIHDLLEKLEEYGDSVEIDGYDVDYGNEVLTLKLGSLGTYVINKQTPNRQIWMSSPVRLMSPSNSSSDSKLSSSSSLMVFLVELTGGNPTNSASFALSSVLIVESCESSSSSPSYRPSWPIFRTLYI